MKNKFIDNIKGFFSNKSSENKTLAFTQNNNRPSSIVSWGPKYNEQFNGNQQTNAQIQSEVKYDQYEKIAHRKDVRLRDGQLHQGEALIYEQKNLISFMIRKREYIKASFILTDYRILVKLGEEEESLDYPLGKIEKLSRYKDSKNYCKVTIDLKDGLILKFRINSEMEWKKFYEVIEKVAFIRNKKNFYAFRYFQANKQLEEQFKGWKLYDPLVQFKRMGIKIMPPNVNIPDQYAADFKILDNTDGKICSTYGQMLIVPARMPHDCLLRCSKFRSRCRMPALTYAYEYEEGKFTSLYRSSQSKVGLQSSRSYDDELMLRLIGNPSLDAKNIPAFEGEPDCYIYDARGYMAALGNRFAGKGYQSDVYYVNCSLQFLGIPNIHAVREEYNKMTKACLADDGAFYNNLAECSWYEYIFLILDGALSIANNMRSGINVLVHCSDGWDRTAQLCSLASIILDPYYRTMEGFQVLIEKDWIHFGHQFGFRMAQGANDPTNQNKSQIFLQYMDCVYQLLHQFPTQFQFNKRYLGDIAQLAYCNLYGNFLFNFQRQMYQYSAFTRTVSIWSYTKKYKEIYLNPYYTPQSSKNFLEAKVSQKYMCIWKEHFYRYSDAGRDVYGIYNCKFTEENLQIMYKQLGKEEQLLKEKKNSNQEVLASLEQQIEKLSKQNSQLELKAHQQKQNICHDS